MEECIYRYNFFLSALIGGDCSLSSPGHFTAGKSPPPPPGLVPIMQEVGWATDRNEKEYLSRVFGLLTYLHE
jgi:hypothetical protein